MGLGGEGGGPEGAAVEVLQVKFCTQAVDAPGPTVTSSSSRGSCRGASDSGHPRSGGRSCCAVDSTGAELAQVQFLGIGRCPCCAGH